jgi:hypothetical protein
MLDSRSEFGWLFGDILERRRAFEQQNPDVLWSGLLWKLQSNLQVQDYWANCIATYRDSLQNPDDAPAKAASEIVVKAGNFDDEMKDAYSEWIASINLRQKGFDSFKVIVPPGGVKKQLSTPDFLAECRKGAAAIEVKNLRAHECVEEVMPDLFLDELIKGRSFSAIKLVVLRSFRGTLNKDEMKRLRRIVQHLLEYELDKTHTEDLSDRAEAVFKIVEGDGSAMCQDFIGINDLKSGMDVYAGLLNKIRVHTCKALGQLYSPMTAGTVTRVVAMRWDVPYVSIPWSSELSQAVMDTFDDAQRVVGLKADLHIFTDYKHVLASTLS